MPLMSPTRMIAISTILFFILFLLFTSFHKSAAPIREKLTASAQQATDRPDFAKNPFAERTFEDSIVGLYDSIRYPLDAEEYTDANGRVFNLSQHRHWRWPLKKELAIIDIDTRKPNGDNELWNKKKKLNWESLGSVMTASHTNHFLYSRIHGYDYKFFNAAHMSGHYDTWIRPHILARMLKEYKFVVLMDADATIQHLELPFEWLMNRWNITPKTSIAMPIDTNVIHNDDMCGSCDSRKKVVLNAGFIVAQNLNHTFDMVDAWAKCTTEERYKGCSKWKNEWSHEQMAFSEYIRYDFNPDENIVEIPCDDAMGYPGIINTDYVLSNCTGQFVRHHTLDKGMTIQSSNNAMLQSMAEIMQTALLSRKDDFWISESGDGWFSKFGWSD